MCIGDFYRVADSGHLASFYEFLLQTCLCASLAMLVAAVGYAGLNQHYIARTLRIMRV
jgi:hypothetical protein